MKIILMVSIIFISSYLFSQFNLELQWESEKIFKTPESIVFDQSNNCLYISNINGKSADSDGNGFISKVGLDGKIIDLKWITKLNAPKGSVIWNGKLYVSDINKLVVIDIQKQKVIKKVKIKYAAFLNDVAADNEGNIYISDSSGSHGAIYKYDGEKAVIWLDNGSVDRPNGLFVKDAELLIGNGGTGQILAVSFADKSISIVAEIGSGIDGLSVIEDGNILVSDWAGKTSLVINKNEIIELINTTARNVNSADLCYIPRLNLVIIPTFRDNRIVAYKLIKK